MIEFKEFVQELREINEGGVFSIRDMVLLNENADAMGKYHELKYAWHATGGKFESGPHSTPKGSFERTK